MNRGRKRGVEQSENENEASWSVEEFVRLVNESLANWPVEQFVVANRSVAKANQG